METIIGGNGQGAAAAPQDLIRDSDEQSFGRDVIEASMQAPVIVDFWAPWCGPCKQLTPTLEKVVREFSGAVKLVKVNVDQSPTFAQQIQSVPTVFAFYQGQPVDRFMGALPESEVRKFVQKLVQETGGEAKSPVEQALEQAEALMAAKQYAQAAALYGQISRHDPENVPAIAGGIRAQLESGDAAGAREAFEALTEAMKQRAELASVAAAIELAEQTASAGDLGMLAVQVERNPNDHQARYDLALALNAAGRREDAVEELLELVRRDRTWNEEAARKQLVKLFDAWGPTDPLTMSARRQLSSLLFA